MKKQALIMILVVFSCFFGCNRDRKSKKTDSPDSTSMNVKKDTIDEKALFEKAVGKTIDPTNTPKYAAFESHSKELGSGIEQLRTTNPAACPAYSKLTDLNSGAEYNVYKFDQSMEAGLQAMGFTGSLSKHEMVFIEDYVRYQICPSNNKRYGVGLRCFIHVSSSKGKISYLSLPTIAANVELNNAKATFSIKSLGFAFDGSVLDGAPTSGDYNVDDFGKIAVIFTNVSKQLTNNSKVVISPVELPVPQQ